MDSSILFGNGINRLSSKNISWSHLLDIIKGTRPFNNGQLPNTMIYERIILEKPNRHDDVRDDEYDVKRKIAELMLSIEPHDIYTQLFRMNARNYLITNYDYGFINSIKDLNDVLLPIQEFSTEDLYSIRRLKEIKNTKEAEKKFWQIHGEIRKPATIMLGLDHYCGSIGKIDSYIKGGYKYKVDGIEIIEPSIEEKFKNESFKHSSWVELFFTTDIHILGFSLDYSEIDLWWILNKRARMKKSFTLRNQIKNKIYFYCDKIEEQQRGLLEHMDVEVELLELTDLDTKYLDYYINLIKLLKRKI